MKAQYINPVVNLTQGLSSNLNVKSTEKSGEFDLIMNQNLSKQKYFDSGIERKEAVADSIKNKPAKDKYEAVEDSSNKVKVQSKKDSTMNSKSTTIDAATNTNPKGKVSVTKEELEAIAEELQTVVMDTLGLTKEELELLLTQQGFTLANLVDSESLKEIVLASTGREDIMEFVTNGDLVQTLQQLVEAVDSVLDKSLMDLTDDEWNQVLKSLDDALLLEETSIQEETLIDDQDVKAPLGSNEEKLQSSSNRTQEETESNAKVEVVFTETVDLQQTDEQSSGHSNLKDQNPAEIQATFMDNLNQVQVQTRIEYQGDEIKVVDVSQIANQILEKIRVVVKPDHTSMEMSLNPENLGKVNLSVQSKGGVLTAQFVVQNEVAKEAIESQLFQLRETLHQQGVKVEAIEVTVASYHFDQNTQAGEGGQSEDKKNKKTQGITLEEALAMTEESVENVENQILAPDMTGTNIDMTA